nr:hypothetical protein [Lentinula edodes]UZS77783.1 hypothetical protein [Lentinula edodes]UZS77833.1 hypothetical protein [Lentinula edodes]UZS77883.1 hypothetical protein [Lentinula edodes]UZS77933.1 hypothetical protein [Lentinula edodes]
MVINQSNNIAQNYTYNPVATVNHVSPTAGFDLERLNGIDSDLNISLTPDLVNSMNSLFRHEVIKCVDGKWAFVLDSETLSSLWTNIFYPYISSNPTTVVAIGSVYLLSGLLIKRSISKFNSKLLSSIRNDSLRSMSNTPTSQELYQHQRLCESHDKVLFLMNSVELILVCGFAYFIGPRLKPNWPPITIPFPQNQYPSNLIPNPNTNPNPYSQSFLLPFLPFNKMSKGFKSILKFILLMFIFIIFSYYGGISFLKSNPYLIKIFIIILSSMVIFYFLLNGLIILNYSIQSNTDNNKDIVTNKYLPKFIKNYLLNLKEISKYKNSNSFVKLYFVGGLVILVMLIIFIIIFL